MRLFNDGVRKWMTIETDKGFEVWSYEPSYDWDGNTYWTTVPTLDEANYMARNNGRRPTDVSH